MAPNIFYVSVFFVLPMTIYSAPTKSTIVCAQYIATNLNAAPELPDAQEYNYEDDKSSIPDDYQANIGENDLSQKTKIEQSVVECSNSKDVCFTVWKTDHNGTILIVRQGCWQSEKQETCLKQQCVSNKPILHSSKNHRFCCCSGNMCNLNITSLDIVSETDSSIDNNDTSGLAPKPIPILKSPIVWICIALVIICLIVLSAFATCRTTKKSEPELAPLAPSNGPGYSSNMYNVDNLKLVAMIGQGKYGTVWKGMINEQSVAVKIFPSQHKQYFQNEKNIYSLPLMTTPSISQYFGCDTRRTLNDSIEYILVLSLAPLGCLQDWLIENTSSFDIFAKMAKSVSRGISHLHTALRKDDLEKPCVCHRDINTRNILVKADLSCCISDFGFALKTFGPRYEWKGEITVAETKSINEVGTLRYMAPEVLEGAVNLRDCETALKQIDVYSLGLVLWELCVRCHDWYSNGQSPPAYKSPYEAEAGKKPTFEHMQVLISRHKARPLFPLGWGGDAAAKIAHETCEECWDHDAEARLTALCVEERIHELVSVYSRATSSCGSSPSQLNTSQFLSTINSTVATTHTINLCENTDTTIITPPNQKITNRNINNDGIRQCPSIMPDDKNQEIFYQAGKHNLMPQIVTQISDDNSFRQHECDVSVEKLLGSSSGEKSIGNSMIIPNACVMGKGLSNKLNIADNKLKGWYGVRAMIQKKLFKRYQTNQCIEDISNLVEDSLLASASTPTHSIEISPKTISTTKTCQEMDNKKLENNVQQIVSIRPKNLDLPNKKNTNTTQQLISNGNGHFKCPPGDNQSQSFAIIKQNPQIIVSKSTNSMKSAGNSLDVIDDRHIKRQRSLEIFQEVFGSKGSIERLRDPSQRVKTPGDVPPSVRKIRASKTLSLYDDRMMDTSNRNYSL